MRDDRQKEYIQKRRKMRSPGEGEGEGVYSSCF